MDLSVRKIMDNLEENERKRILETYKYFFNLTKYINFKWEGEKPAPVVGVKHKIKAYKNKESAYIVFKKYTQNMEFTKKYEFCKRGKKYRIKESRPIEYKNIQKKVY